MPVSGTPREIVGQEMHRFKRGQLHSGSHHGPIVKNRAQAIAIALSEARRHKPAGRAFGGISGQPVSGGNPMFGSQSDMLNMAGGLAVMPSGMGGTYPLGSLNDTGIGAQGQTLDSPFLGIMGGGMGGSPPANPPAMGGLGLPPGPPQIGGANPPPNPPAMGNMFGGLNLNSFVQNPTLHPPANPPAAPQMPNPPANPQAAPQMPHSVGFGPGRQFGGLTRPPAPSATLRNEARSMLHSGPISSVVPGRTDRHNVNVGSGSYIMPADAVSHLGQNNTKAGQAILSSMFGGGGPYGVKAMPLKRGTGAPKLPGMQKQGMPHLPKLQSAGGGKGDRTGEPVPIVVAGGEFTIPESVVMEIGGGDIRRGHRILDAWVLSIRKQHIKTLKGLPPPAKS